MADIERVGTVERAREISNGKNALIFKHSTRCPVSTRTERIFTAFAEEWSGVTLMCIVDVIGDRDVSNAIADETGVLHQSPQAIVIQDGAVTANTSHYDITRSWLERELQ